MLYCAYGSNLNLNHLRAFLASRGVPARHVQTPRLAILPDHRLRTNYASWVQRAGACNVEPSQGRVVEGIGTRLTSMKSRWISAIQVVKGRRSMSHTNDEYPTVELSMRHW
jgi:hypothetical protein